MKQAVAEPYGVPVAFVKSRKGWSTLTGEPPPDGAVGVCQWASGLLVIGWFDRRAQTLCHECVHAGLAILEYVGIDPRDSQGEALAYLTDWLFGQGFSPASRPA
ncbi:hypothetical protein HOR55_gp02 [Ralstonia phage RS-PII-1]|uniref:Uncharacterized protein n=1 Tax=Ralstonia phage RS-PII-1 TaxID=1932892 RepID=A0A1L7DQ89_9CAUD|nr:hypothetical protein HOR55_gp02 [Ralstonia phage RS-PII-1]APU00289.1 hypothetical protein [Ralstonia phage RS-PII-1]